jgi:hypothetical protein
LGQPQSFSVSIASPPMVLANSLPVKELDRAAPLVVKWVDLNKTELMRF